VSGSSPTALSLAHLRSDGWLVDVCERWVPLHGGKIKRDLFGLIDLVAVRPGETLGVQTTSSANFNARLNKMTDDDHYPAVSALMSAGWQVVIHGWRKSTRDGHACKHGHARCGCRWVLHREITLHPRVEP
jgi:hypothetical protein